MDLQVLGVNILTETKHAPYPLLNIKNIPSYQCGFGKILLQVVYNSKL